MSARGPIGLSNAAAHLEVLCLILVYDVREVHIYPSLMENAQKLLLSQGLREYADDPAFQEKWQEVKQIAKTKAVEKIAQITGEEIPPQALLDIQVRA